DLPERGEVRLQRRKRQGDRHLLRLQRLGKQRTAACLRQQFRVVRQRREDGQRLLHGHRKQVSAADLCQQREVRLQRRCVHGHAALHEDVVPPAAKKEKPPRHWRGGFVSVGRGG